MPRLLGGLPGEVPERYRLASPQRQLPLAVPVRCLHARDDDTVPFSQSVDYVRAARAAGADARLVEVTGGHFGVIDPASPAWQADLDLLPELLAADCRASAGTAVARAAGYRSSNSPATRKKMVG